MKGLSPPLADRHKDPFFYPPLSEKNSVVKVSPSLIRKYPFFFKTPIFHYFIMVTLLGVYPFSFPPKRGELMASLCFVRPEVLFVVGPPLFACPFKNRFFFKGVDLAGVIIVAFAASFFFPADSPKASYKPPPFPSFLVINLAHKSSSFSWYRPSSRGGRKQSACCFLFWWTINKDIPFLSFSPFRSTSLPARISYGFFKI